MGFICLAVPVKHPEKGWRIFFWQKKHPETSNAREVRVFGSGVHHRRVSVMYVHYAKTNFNINKIYLFKP